MFFRPRRLKDERREAWLAFAGRLEPEDASDVAERLRRWLDLESVALEPLYALRKPGLPLLYLFEYLKARRGPAGEVSQRVSACLLRSETSFAPLPLRAQAKRNKVMESIEASRSGSQLVSVEPDFDNAVTVFARDVEGAASVLRPPLRQVLMRALTERSEGVSLVLGERHALVSVEVEEEVPLVTLELLMSDLLSLYALLTALAAP